MGALILIVDDDGGLRSLGSAVLTRAGFAVATACDGVEGLQMSAWLRPRLIILDMNMPHLDGLSLLSELDRLEGPRPLVIAWSGEPELEPAARARGAAAFLRKPISLLELVETATALLADPSRVAA